MYITRCVIWMSVFPPDRQLKCATSPASAASRTGVETAEILQTSMAAGHRCYLARVEWVYDIINLYIYIYIYICYIYIYIENHYDDTVSKCITTDMLERWKWCSAGKCIIAFLGHGVVKSALRQSLSREYQSLSCIEQSFLAVVTFECPEPTALK